MIQLFIVIILLILIEGVSYFYQKQLDRIIILRAFLWVGIFIHEFSHYLACKLFLAPVSEFKVGLRKGHVQHGKSRIPILGSLFISMAPLIVGLTSLILLFWWYFNINILEVNLSAINFNNLIKQISLSQWQFWLWLFFNLNILAIFVPSKQDFKNITFILILYIITSIFIPKMIIVNSMLSLALIFALILLLIASALLYLINFIKSAPIVKKQKFM